MMKLRVNITQLLRSSVSYPVSMAVTPAQKLMKITNSQPSARWGLEQEASLFWLRYQLVAALQASEITEKYKN